MVATKAVASHCAWSCPTPKAPITVGTATLAMVDESTIAISPAIPEPVTSQLVVGDAAAVDNESSRQAKPNDAVLFDPRRTEVHHVGAERRDCGGCEAAQYSAHATNHVIECDKLSERCAHGL